MYSTYENLQTAISIAKEFVAEGISVNHSHL